ncbi:Myb-like_DNA-binding domain-containing protein [Hexamita inflata]|uniref:Myb-like DNA-binding domain-containing protein n=1 Tax=Hexamita inflata TaxID=28002 RepID=A0AA86U5W6_9EUKA|nr:Myb-like DNA-binding domain-containing protein [Hexamita inflata]
MKRDFYKAWMDEDIRLLLNVTEKYSNSTIDWIKVAENFKNRTPQQCKSFFNNKMKKFVFNMVDGVPQPDYNLIQYCYAFYITRYKPENEMVDERCKRIMAEACYEDILPTMALIVKNDLNYKYNKKLLVGTKEFLIYHKSQVAYIDELFTKSEIISIQNISIRKKQWETFCMYINILNLDLLLQKIDQLLVKIL